MNKVILLGNLTKETEVRYTKDGAIIASNTIAVNKRYKTKSGEQKEQVCFIDLTFFGGLANLAKDYLHKGSKVLIEGELIQEQWTDNSGAKRSKHSVRVTGIDMLGKPSDGKGAGGKKSDDRYPETPQIDVDNDDIPF